MDNHDLPRALIVAYGNPLRSDDGVAWRAADALESEVLEQAEIVRLHQLAPEVADALQHRDLVIFLDAACVDNVENGRPGEIRVREISGPERQEREPGQFTHAYSPGKILTLARNLYDATPRAFVITVAGENFGHGDSLSASVAKALPELTRMIREIINDRTKTGKTTDTRRTPNET